MEERLGARWLGPTKTSAFEEDGPQNTDDPKGHERAVRGHLPRVRTEVIASVPDV